ncbi:MAG: thioredoxin domain-containing protein [Candidatus Omnitrophota bacterium]
MVECNKFVRVMALILAGLVVAASIVFCVTMVVNASMAPVVGIVREMVLAQKDMNKSVAANTQGMTAVLARITALETENKQLKSRLSAPVAPSQPPEDMNRVYDLKVGDSYVNGNPEAPITIIEFSDFQCPYCVQSHPVIQEVLKAFPKDVKAVLKNYPLPFHQNARPAAKAALAAGLQGKYYPMVALLMENSKDLSEEKYKELAAKAGLNVARFLKDLKEQDAAFEKKIMADMEEALKADVRGTPSYFLNGKKVNIRNLTAWKAAIEPLLKK